MIMSLKVMLISPQFPPEIDGGGNHTYYLSRELSKLEVKFLKELRKTN